jgi:uncharacterized membrane protein
MIQRFQSVFLLIASILSFVMMFTPFQSIANSPNNDSVSSNPLIYYTLIGLSILALANIFLYSNRRLQIKLTWACVGLSLIVLIQLFTLYTNAIKDNVDFFTYYFALPFLQLFCLGLAIFFISKDEKLVRDADRLR